MDKVTLFLYFFMYNLEKYLNTRQDELISIFFQSDEANTDRPLKEYMKNIIERCQPDINRSTNISELIINNKLYKKEIVENMFIQRVLLPEEINSTIKHIIIENKPHSVYTNPDLCLEINDSGKLLYETIELKTTKGNAIPGSSVQQVVPNEWAIFIKHTNRFASVTIGKYINAVTSTIQFPDRSPRPQVSFLELSNWNKEYRVENDKQLIYYNDPSIEEKCDIVNDWQEVLADRWMEIVFDEGTLRKKEPWFNNNIRKFAVKLINKYEMLDDNSKNLLINDLYRLIDEYERNDD